MSEPPSGRRSRLESDGGRYLEARKVAILREDGGPPSYRGVRSSDPAPPRLPTWWTQAHGLGYSKALWPSRTAPFVYTEKVVSSETKDTRVDRRSCPRSIACGRRRRPSGVDSKRSSNRPTVGLEAAPIEREDVRGPELLRQGDQRGISVGHWNIRVLA